MTGSSPLRGYTGKIERYAKIWIKMFDSFKKLAKVTPSEADKMRLELDAKMKYCRI